MSYEGTRTKTRVIISRSIVSLILLVVPILSDFIEILRPPAAQGHDDAPGVEPGVGLEETGETVGDVEHGPRHQLILLRVPRRTPHHFRLAHLAKE